MCNKISFITFIFFWYGCGINSKNYIKNQAIENQVQIFSNVSKQSYFEQYSKDTILIRFTKINKFYKVEFEAKQPTNFFNIYGVIDDKQYVIFIYGNEDLQNFFMINKPHQIDTTVYKITTDPPIEIDWYSDEMYFDGIKFFRDTLKM